MPTSGLPRMTLFGGILATLVIAGLSLQSLRNRRELEKIQQRLEQITDHAPIGVFQLYCKRDGHRQATYYSRQVAELMGITPAELAADRRNLFRYAAPEDWGAYDAKSSIRRLPERQAWATDLRLCIDGEERWIHSVAEPMPLENGDTLYNGYIEDITQGRRQQAQLLALSQEQQIILENVPVGVAFSGDGKYIQVNRSFARLFGDPRGEQLIGAETDRIFPVGGQLPRIRRADRPGTCGARPRRTRMAAAHPRRPRLLGAYRRPDRRGPRLQAGGDLDHRGHQRPAGDAAGLERGQGKHRGDDRGPRPAGLHSRPRRLHPAAQRRRRPRSRPPTPGSAGCPPAHPEPGPGLPPARGSLPAQRSRAAGRKCSRMP